MFGNKHFVRYFIYVFAVFYTFHKPISAEQTKEIPSLYSSDTLRAKLTPPQNSLERVPLESNVSQVANSLNGLNLDLLETAFSSTSRLYLPPPVRRVCGGVIAAFASVLSFQALVPMGMIGLGKLGLTSEVLPPDSEGTNAVVALMALTPLIIGGEATYKAVLRRLKTPAPEVLEALKIVNKRQLSKIEAWTYSYPTQFVQMLFWSALNFALIMNIESRVQGWGDPVIWGAVLGTLILPAVWALFVSPNNNPNEGIMHFFWNKADRNSRENCLGKLSAVEDVIKEKGLTSRVRALGGNFGVLSDENEGNEHNDDNDDRKVVQGAQSDWSPIADPQRVKRRYEVILGTMQEIILKDSISYLERWNRFNSNLGGVLCPVMQATAFPARIILTYGLMHKFAAVCGGDDKINMGLGATTAVLTGLFHVLAAAKESSSLKREINDTLHLWKPQKTWGPKSIAGKVFSRIPPLLARGAVVVYFLVPFKDYLEKGILGAEVGIANPVTQEGLILPFMIAAIYPPVAQFIGGEYDHITNWFASGGPLGKRRVLWFLDSHHYKENTLDILDRTEDFRRIVEGLNFVHTSHVNAELGDNVRTGLLKS